jgi:hypothetical protein
LSQSAFATTTPQSVHLRNVLAECAVRFLQVVVRLQAQPEALADQKKTQKTAKGDLELAARRYKLIGVRP